MKSHLSIRRFFGLCLALLFAVSVAAQEAKKEHSFSEKTSEGLKKLGELQQQQPPPYPAMLAHIESMITLAGPTSYDMAYLQNIRARLLAAMDKYAPAIEAWELALKLSDQFGYFETKETNDMALYLSQIMFIEAGNIKNPAQQSAQINKALGYLKRHLDNTKKPSLDTQALYAQLLYQQAVSNDKNIDQARLKEAREVVEKAMLSTQNPKESFYLLLIAIMQQQNEMTRASEYLELFLKKFPGKKDYWPVLVQTYVSLAQAEKDPEKGRDFYIRAINAIERAQKLGFMKTPKDNYALVTIYITAGQFSMATELLHKHLKEGTIESTLSNWRILGSYYQQASKDQEAIGALKEAIAKFPKEGMLDLQIGEIYRQQEKTKEAGESYVSAIRKGNLEKPVVAYQLLAYSLMETGDFDGAKKVMDELRQKYPEEFNKDAQIKSLADHIDNTLKEREELKRQKEEQKQKGK